MKNIPTGKRTSSGVIGGMVGVLLILHGLAHAQDSSQRKEHILSLDVANTLLLRPGIVYERVFRGNRKRPFSLQFGLSPHFALKPKANGKNFFLQSYMDDAVPIHLYKGVSGCLGWMKFLSDKGPQPNRFGRYIGLRIHADLLRYEDVALITEDSRHFGQYFNYQVQDQQKKSIGLQFCTGSRQMIGRTTFLDFFFAVGFNYRVLRTRITENRLPNGSTGETVRSEPGLIIHLGLRLGKAW